MFQISISSSNPKPSVWAIVPIAMAGLANAANKWNIYSKTPRQIWYNPIKCTQMLLCHTFLKYSFLLWFSHCSFICCGIFHWGDIKTGECGPGRERVSISCAIPCEPASVLKSREAFTAREYNSASPAERVICVSVMLCKCWHGIFPQFTAVYCSYTLNHIKGNVPEKK